MSIHKSQGQTLERVKVDLGRVFEKGQAYVALSRATTLDGLQVLNFDPAKVCLFKPNLRPSNEIPAGSSPSESGCVEQDPLDDYVDARFFFYVY